MSARGHKSLSYLLSGLFCVVLPLVSLGEEPQTGPQGATDLLRDIPGPGKAGVLPKKPETLGIKTEVARKFYERQIAGSPYREGTLDWDLLMRLVRDDKSPGPKRLKLLPGVVVEFTPKKYEPLKGRDSVVGQKYRWSGLVTNKEKVVGEGLFIIDEKRRNITATIQYNDKVYEIISLKNRNVRVFEVKANRFPDENPTPPKSALSHGSTGGRATHDEKDDEPAPAPGDSSQPASADQPCLIDVLVLYTQDAEETWLKQGYVDIWMEF